MNGQQLLTALAGLLGNENLDPVQGLFIINMARVSIQERRPWECLKKTDDSQIVQAGKNINTPIYIPPDFSRWIDKAEIVLVPASNQNTQQTIREVPIEKKQYYQNRFGFFVTDFSQVTPTYAGLFYVMGQVPQQYTAFQNYISDPGDITLGTSWGSFPTRYHRMLAFEGAAMWRLGTDYDSLNARNADDNARRSDMLYKGMINWDANLAVANIEDIDPAAKHRPANHSDGYPPRIF